MKLMRPTEIWGLGMISCTVCKFCTFLKDFFFNTPKIHHVTRHLYKVRLTVPPYGEKKGLFSSGKSPVKGAQWGKKVPKRPFLPYGKNDLHQSKRPFWVQDFRRPFFKFKFLSLGLNNEWTPWYYNINLTTIINNCHWQHWFWITETGRWLGW